VTQSQRRGSSPKVPLCDVSGATSALPEIDLDADPAFSTENESPFRSFEPQFKQTGIFIDRFFHKFSYKDLAVKYEITDHDAIKVYHHAVNRVLDVLQIMDEGTEARKREQYVKKTEERSGKLPKGQRWYLLNKLFGLRPSEIAEMEGLDKKRNSVRQLIIRVSDQLKAGEIRLIETTPEESKAAKARLDEHRKKRRERYERNIRS
jgi:hypothetical protein